MSCPKFVSRSLAQRTAAHRAHLSAPTYARHVALGAFYEGLEALVDRYAEIYMGLKGVITSFPASAVPQGTAEEMLRDYLDDLREEAGEDHGSEAMKNVLAELEELTAQTIYKLVNLR